MPNFIKRIEKFSDNQLQAGETIVSTAFLQQKGAFSHAVARSSFGLIGMLLHHFFSKDEKQKLVSTASPLSKKIPEGTLLIAITSKHRILVYKHKDLGASIQSFSGEFHRGDVVKVDLQSRLIMNNLTLYFKDGGQVKLEAVLGQKLKDFAELIAKP